VKLEFFFRQQIWIAFVFAAAKITDSFDIFSGIIQAVIGGGGHYGQQR